MSEETVRKQKPKKGRVVRISPALVERINREQKDGEPLVDTLDRMFGVASEVRYVLPSDIHETVEDARGVAILKAVRSKVKKTERPVAIRTAK